MSEPGITCIDQNALEMAIVQARDGECVGVFPDGTFKTYALDEKLMVEPIVEYPGGLLRRHENALGLACDGLDSDLWFSPEGISVEDEEELMAYFQEMGGATGPKMNLIAHELFMRKYIDCSMKVFFDELEFGENDFDCDAVNDGYECPDEDYINYLRLMRLVLKSEKDRAA